MLKEEFRLAMALTGETCFLSVTTTSVSRFLRAFTCPVQGAIVTYRREIEMFVV